MSFALPWAVVTALLVSLALPLVVLPVLRRRNVVDVPVERSSHTVTTVRGGGVAPAAGLLVGLAVLAATTDGTPRALLVTVAGGATATAVVGLVEDVRGLRARTRAGLQLLLGAAVVVATAAVAGLPWWLAVLGLVFFAAYVNVANFMDGINGISGLHGVVVGLAYAVTGVLDDVPWLVGAGACLAAVFLAFLPWNLRAPHVFLGDVGSYLLGGTIAATAVAASAAGVAPVVLLAPLLPYLVDTATTLARRVTAGEVWHEAHRTHVYQRLAASPGLGHLRVAALVAVVSAVSFAASLLTRLGAGGTAAAVGLLLALATAYAALPRVLRHAPAPTPEVRHA